MGKRRGWPEELAERCRAVGWAVQYTNSGHYKVRIPPSDEHPAGGGFSISSTPGSYDSERKSLNNANRYGLERLELQIKLQAEKDRLQRIELDRAQNGVPEERMQTPEPNPTEENEMAKYGTVEVDGVKIGIAEISKPVMHRHPRGGEPYALPHCRELLLVDESIRYQCLKLVRGDQVCARHFKTPGGLVVHWARSLHVDSASRPEPRDLGASAEPNPVEPRPGPTKEEIRTPVAVYTTPDPKKVEESDLAVPTGLMAQAVFQVERLRKLEDQLDELADAAGSIAGHLEALIEKLPEELVSPELQEKAEKFDAMMKALGQ